ncbi:MAG TPA: hypothetical protein VFZ16_12260 [Hyphomicrobiaceae bacterium]|nr:hypothetical protein [Hyphomicrobiaceae bacterium]
MPDWKLPLTGVALGLTIGLAAAAPAPAAAAPAVPPSWIIKADAGSMVTQVRRYRHYRRFHHHHHHGGRFGRGVGVGIGLGIIGGIIASEAYRSAPAYADDEVYDAPPPGDPRELCARNFRSFEWNTGLYTTYGGEKKLCPYLR